MGIIVIDTEGPLSGYIHFIYIKPEFRRQGIATQALLGLTSEFDFGGPLCGNFVSIEGQAFVNNHKHWIEDSPFSS